MWSLLCFFYIVFAVMQIYQEGFNGVEFVKTLAGLIGFLGTFILILYQRNLTFNFYWTRFKNWLRNYPTKWKLDVRFDGSFNDDLISTISDFLLKLNSSNKVVKIFHKTVNSINFSIKDTLNFYLDYQPSSFSGVDYDTIDISLAAFEIGSNDSKIKLNSDILPLFTRFQELLKPNNTSFVLNITFLKGNPFYSVFISHLKPSQINSFNINLHLDNYSDTINKNIVMINKENVIVNAHDIHSLKELSYDFIYFSTNVKHYLKV